MLKAPSMVLFEFAPTKGFREFAKKVESFRKFAAALRAVATGLRLLHQSAVMVESPYATTPSPDTMSPIVNARPAVERG